MNIIDKLNAEQIKDKSEFPKFGSGDTVRVHQLIQEGNKERIQIFEGVVIRRNGGGIAESFTVRKVSYNVGVERSFLLNSPRLKKVEVKQYGRVRRARLYYLRNLRGKAARIQQARYVPEKNAVDKNSAEKEASAAE